MRPDPLHGALWACAPTPAGALEGPCGLTDDLDWCPAPVPGTVAGAWRDDGRQARPAPEATGRALGASTGVDFDALDWWYRTTVTLPGTDRWWLHAEGLATIGDVWVDDRAVLHSENMWVGRWVELGELAGEITVTLRFAALEPLLAVRRPRPRWKSRLVLNQSLRWIRTSLWGRMPAFPQIPPPVGPWRPLSLQRSADTVIFERRMVATPHAAGGTVDVCVRGRFPGLAAAGGGRVRVAGAEEWVTVTESDGATVLSATVAPRTVQRWWPHTHGTPQRYPVELLIGPEEIPLGSVGFRTVTADRSDGGFTLVVNDVTVFARGACWHGPDPVGLNPGPEAVGAALDRFATTGFNLVRVAGITVYEDEGFWEACDARGLLVWCEAMLSALDLPDDPGFAATLSEELHQVFTRAANHPSLAVICGGAETEQQPAMLGLPPDVWGSTQQSGVIAQTMATIAPDIAYVSSSPSGGVFPFTPDAGVAQYFGVGAYLRPLDHARRAGVRFAAECLALANVPDEAMVDRIGGPAGAGHAPAWKSGVPRDPGASWDFEDVRDHYVRELFGVDPMPLRYREPGLALDYGRAASVELMAATFGEWRRAASPCAGAIMLSWRDVVPGAGFGITDAGGAPKAPWYALRRLLSPVAVWLVDEDLAGLRFHVGNDLPEPLHATLRVRLWAPDGVALESVTAPVTVAGHSTVTGSVDRLFDGFRDLTYAYRFGPPAHDVILVELDTGAPHPAPRAFFLPLGPARARIPDCGLAATARPGPGGVWSLAVVTEAFAHHVSVVVAGFEPSDDWFHLEPGGRAELTLRPIGTRARPTGEVRALNSMTAARIAIADPE